MDNENVIEKTDPAEETHRNLFEVLIDFWIEGFNFLKYIFYDLLLGK